MFESFSLTQLQSARKMFTRVENELEYRSDICSFTYFFSHTCGHNHPVCSLSLFIQLCCPCSSVFLYVCSCLSSLRAMKKGSNLAKILILILNKITK